MKTLKFSLVCICLGSLSLPAEAIEELTAASAPVSAASAPVSAVSNSAINVGDPKKTTVTFMDSKLFDGRLAKELEAGKETVEIDISGRMPINNIPLRIDRWLIVSAEEGTVETLPSPPKVHTRALFAVVPMVFSAYSYWKNMREEKMYDTAKQYDTKIYYRKDENGDSLIEKIVLVKRAQPVKPAARW